MLYQIADRSIESLQFKYKHLKKLARNEKSELNRDMVKTGNKPLQSKTIKALRDSNMLLQLRNRMGPTATGFQSKHCK